jgi:hypothetical protein
MSWLLLKTLLKPSLTQPGEKKILVTKVVEKKTFFKRKVEALPERI